MTSPQKVLLIAVIAVTVAICVALLTRPSPAERTFLNGLGSVQADESDGHLIEVGHDICEALRSGKGVPYTQRYFGAPDPLAVSLQQATFLTAATADGSLCPDQRAVVDGWIAR